MAISSDKPAAELRTLRILKEEYGRSVFNRKTVLLVQHLLPDAEPVIDAFLWSCLTQHLFVVGIPYSSKQHIVQRIQEKLGAGQVCAPAVYPLYQGDDWNPDVTSLFEAALDTCQGEHKLVIVEDGAYALPYLMQKRPDAIQQCIGVAQQTTRGLRIYERLLEDTGMSIPFPVVPLVDCELKRELEPAWIVPTILGNVHDLLARARPGVEPFEGKRVTVVGLGTIGLSLARELENQLGANVTGVDDKERRLMRAGYSDVECGLFEELAPQSDMIIGTTGELKPSVDRYLLERLKDGTVLVSTSSGNEEIDLAALEEMSTRVIPYGPTNHAGVMPIPDYTEYLLRDGRTIVVLYGGFPINFWSLESMRANEGDVILSLLFATAKKIARGEVVGSRIVNGDRTLADEQERIARHYRP